MAEIEKTEIQIAEEWLAIAIENWQKEIKIKDIGNLGELYSSFHGKVIANASSLHAVEIAYAWYGQMVDMGVGRGMNKKGPVKSNSESSRMLGSSDGRKPKPWYTGGETGIVYQQKRLTVLLANAMANEVVKKIKGSISTKHIITIK